MHTDIGDVLKFFGVLEEELPGPGGYRILRPGDPVDTAIVEIAGRDGIAAALVNPSGASRYVPTIVYTGTEYGDPAVLLDNISFLEEKLAGRVEVLAPVVMGSPPWWAAVNGRPSSVLSRKYGNPFICAGCHMYLHALRVLLARSLGISTVVSGERERHAGRIKLSQAAPALDAYVEVAGRYGVELAQPLRYLDGDEEMAALVGDWPEGRRQRGCVLSGNHLEPDGGLDESLLVGPLRDYLREYLVPVTAGLVDAHLESGSGRVDAVRVAGIVRANLAADRRR